MDVHLTDECSGLTRVLSGLSQRLSVKHATEQTEAQSSVSEPVPSLVPLGPSGPIRCQGVQETTLTEHFSWTDTTLLSYIWYPWNVLLYPCGSVAPPGWESAT